MLPNYTKANFNSKVHKELLEHCKVNEPSQEVLIAKEIYFLKSYEIRKETIPPEGMIDKTTAIHSNGPKTQNGGVDKFFNPEFLRRFRRNPTTLKQMEEYHLMNLQEPMFIGKDQPRSTFTSDSQMDQHPIISSGGGYNFLKGRGPTQLSIKQCHKMTKAGRPSGTALDDPLFFRMVKFNIPNDKDWSIFNPDLGKSNC